MTLTRIRLNRLTTGTGGAPPLPTGLTATAGDSQVALSWTAPDPADDVTDYRVQYRTSPSGSWNTFSDGVSTTTSATVTGLTNGTTYDFQVAAIRSGTVGDYTPPASATPTALAGPTGLTAVPGDGSVTLTWVAPSPATGVTDYSNQYRISPSGTWQTFAHAVSTATTRTVTGLSNSVTYDFRVAAVRSGVVGDYTAGPISATPVAGSTPVDIYTEHVGFGNPGLFNPVTIVVTSNADSGAGTLRAAIAGSAHKHITFATNMTITVSSALLKPGPNTLIDGRGKNVIIQGTNTMGGFFLDNVWNVTLTDLTLRNFGDLALTSSNAPEDAILMYGSRDIWLHHLDLSTAADKAIGVQQGCDTVTVSWCHFHNQEQVFQIGSQSGGEVVDAEQKVTVHHNYFDGTGYRHPVCSYGRAHVFNNYYRDWEQYAARSQRIGRMHFERNVMLGVRSSKATLIDTPGNGCNDSGSNCDDRDGFLTLVGNIALPASVALAFRSNGTTFDPHTFYAYTAETAGQALADAVVAGVGPR